MPTEKPAKKSTPRQKAVALRYDTEQQGAPQMVAKGSGAVAEKLIAIAKEHGVPIHQDADLTEILSRLDLYQEIPPETYLLVAEILAFIYRTNQSYR
ncbi:EscU/YscU/HrcU family type III secretion system export apparatus switch protein [Desulfurivibrio dismutans]|uniref:EscU/YscU/HrcU family type III secretion system export apparatus switch protein n=1 Tax=Desulfurivibrio dismutans TaxID=1398908 RepID=UPI0023DC6D3A|nr:EscU/YscU/HrcU family type III secretion system export apparatus switch protein [Desulfurivibrio alkaliphilus]MDF1615421.1 EscU/YscU/HrcU family type III secretion system export apparatus switch protein [Desulfurivibrio alkaliphilus]